ncbi:MAG: ROK family protein [Bacteroidales bacterium]|nr:ROK family protein [Bacteroidales bacterium]
MATAKSEVLIGVDLGGTKVAVGKIKDGELKEEYFEKVPAASEDPQETIGLITGIICKLIDNDVVGIGIGVPGLVNKEQGIVYDVHNIPAWKEVHLKRILEKEFQVPVHLDNDSNCFALGEYRYGAYSGEKDFVGITLGTGMGAGIIKNGTLIPDANRCSGEFGNILYLDGIYENYCSGMFFAREYDRNGEAVAIEASKGEKWALEAYHEFGMHLGNGIKTIQLAVDPRMIIIGGSLAKAQALFIDSMWKSISDTLFPSTLKNFKVKFSETANVAILGAAALYFDAQGNQSI